MKAKILPVSLVLIVGAIGFMIGRNSGSRSETPPATSGGSSSRNLSAGSGSIESSASVAKRSSGGSGSRGVMEKKSTSSSSPLTRLAEMKNVVDPLDRTRQWLQFVDSLGENEFESVVAAFREDGIPEGRMGDYSMLLTAWAKLNPLAAMDYASKNIKNPFAGQTILAAWAGYDPNSAISWAKANHKGDDANPWMVGVIKGIAFQDRELASSLLVEMPRSVERGQALDGLLPSLLQQGIDKTRDWVNSLTDDALRDGAVTRVANQTMEKDPLGTADWLIANPTETSGRMVDDALYAMTKKDEQAAMDYYSKLPAGDARSNSLRGIINATATEDPQRAVALMDAHSSDVTNRVVEQFVWHSFQSNPQLAVANIGRLTDVQSRDRMYSRTIDYWLNNDPQAAIAWVNNNNLPANVSENVNRSIQNLQQQKKN